MADINANSIRDVKSFNNVSVVAVAVTGAAVPLQPQFPSSSGFNPVATPPASPGEPADGVSVSPSMIPKEYDDESLVFAAIMEKAGLYSLQVGTSVLKCLAVFSLLLIRGSRFTQVSEFVDIKSVFNDSVLRTKYNSPLKPCRLCLRCWVRLRCRLCLWLWSSIL
jgi:hypothetical protein